MSYPEIPHEADDSALKEFLLDIGSRKEFVSLIPSTNINSIQQAQNFGVLVGCQSGTGGRAYYPCNTTRLELPMVDGLRLHGAQLFVENFDNPNTPWTRLLLNWQTGTGKSIAAISIAQQYVSQFLQHHSTPPAERPSIFIVGFTRNIIQAEMLRRPELGFVSYEEVNELRRLRDLAARSSGPISSETRHLNGFLSTLKRRLTDRTRGGYYKFYGYKEFVNQLFIPTPKGEAENFDIQQLFLRDTKQIDDEEAIYTESTCFVERISAAEEANLIRLDHDLLNQLKHGLLIADEIHNVYNVQERNNYGVALQYVLDAFPPSEAPRAVFMSATPVTGSAAEVIDLLNLLVPINYLPGKRSLKRSDLFETTPRIRGMSRAVSEYKSGALDIIAKLAAGRVSFLLDTDANSYPKRHFAGKKMVYNNYTIPYLYFTPCPMSTLHEETLKSLTTPEHTIAIAANSYTLYDMVFPNPSSTKFGLYTSGDTLQLLAAAPVEWRDATKVVINEPETGSRMPLTIGGEFLALPNVKTYSTKYARLVEDIIAAVRAGPGKILVYHNRVRMSGVLLIQELLNANGFIDEDSIPTDNVLCGICGYERRNHTKVHTYTPARYIIINGMLDRNTMEKNMMQFNVSSNLYGHQIRILVGSKIITEGLNFTAVRFEFVTSLLADISTLIQVFGRVVRKDSHAELPPDQRNVTIRLYVSTSSSDGIAPELSHYADKMHEYERIQEGDRALRRYAIDGFANYERMRNLTKSESVLEALPYSPVVSADNVRKKYNNDPTAANATFEAYGHSTKEVETIVSIIKALFRVRPVWTYPVLWQAVKTPGLVQGIYHDPSFFNENNFALALNQLCEPPINAIHFTERSIGSPREIETVRIPHVYTWGEPRRIVGVNGINTYYYILAPLDASGHPVIDVESYIRDFHPPNSIKMRVTDYTKDALAARNFRLRLEKFEHRFANSQISINLLLVQYDAAFQYSLLKLLVEEKKQNVARQRAIDLYRSFHVLITRGEVYSREDARRALNLSDKKPEKLIGYVTETDIQITLDKGEWKELPHSSLGIKSRYNENGIVVGYMELRGSHLRFKIRPPLQILAREKVPDIRSLTRGAVCETRPRDEQECLACRLGALSKEKIRTISSSDICNALRDRLLDLELQSRKKLDGVRWFYLFNERMPSIILGSSESKNTNE